MRKALIFLSPLLLVTQGCALFAVGKPIVTTQSAGCSSLVPVEWALGITGAPLPVGEDIADWIVFGDQQTGRLDMANDRTRTAISIVRECEKRDAEAVKKATRRGLFGG